MRLIDIIRKAIPDASEELCDFIIWGRTAFPAGPLTAKLLYQAAARYQRAEANHRVICEFGDNLATKESLCQSCATALHCSQ